MDLFGTMMKNLGINPEEIMTQVKAFAEATQQIANTINRIETKIDALQNDVTAIKRHVGVSGDNRVLTIQG